MTSALTLFVFLLGFQVLFAQSFALILVKEPKYFFNWSSSFWLTLFWVFSLEFRSNIIVSANMGAVVNLEISSWLLIDTKLRTLFFHFPLV